MGAGQRKLGEGVVIERYRLPRGSAVASLAGLRESGLSVGWVARLLEVGKVAAHTSGWRPGEFSSDVAGCTGQRNMRSRQSKSRKLQVVERSAEPVIRTVALFTSCGKTQGHMVRTGGGLKVLGMAGIAGGRHRLILRSRQTFVT